VEGGASNSNGHTVDTGTPTAETYDAVSGMWTYTAPMHIGRTEHDATLLLDGTVLITGGLSNADSSDLYHPDTRNFTQPAGVLQPRQRHVAILLPPSWGSLGRSGPYHRWGFNRQLCLWAACNGRSIQLKSTTLSQTK
jgi:hypothetical protein